MAFKAASLAGKLYKIPKANLLTEEGSHLPESYKKFYKEWRLTTPSAVHHRHPTEITWVKNENGEMKRIDDCLIPVLYPAESHKGIWGGEGVIKGFQKRQQFKAKVPHYWVPNLKKSAVYSEILDKRMEVTVTERTIVLILENYGFDHYILKTPACDLQSSLALKLKRKMLQHLYYKELYPDNPGKQEIVYNKYKHYLDNYTEEDIEWYGLTFTEALKKYNEMNKSAPKPLKQELRIKLIEKLIMAKEQPEQTAEVAVEDPSWISKINPFSKSTS